MAQEVALNVLAEHPAVLKDPEPWVLVESLGASTVNLRIYFWMDGSEYSWQKVRSSLIRLVKRAYLNAGISMPGETRELIFPDVIAFQQVEPDGAKPVAQVTEEPDTISTDAEAGLRSDAEEIGAQARFSRTPEEGENLLEQASDG
jgi:small-conductance mechanosensitive channel